MSNSWLASDTLGWEPDLGAVRQTKRSNEPIWELTRALLSKMGRPRDWVLDAVGDPIFVAKNQGGDKAGRKWPFYDRYDYYHYGSSLCPFFSRLSQERFLPCSLHAYFNEKGKLSSLWWNSRKQQGSIRMTTSLRSVLPTLVPDAKPKDFEVYLSVDSSGTLSKSYTRLYGVTKLPGGQVLRFVAVKQGLHWLTHQRKLNRLTEEFEDLYTLRPGATDWADADIEDLFVGDAVPLMSRDNGPEFRPKASLRVITHPTRW